MQQTHLYNASLLAGRSLMAFIFIMAGINKLGEGYAGTQGYMEAFGVPGALLPAVIVQEIAGGIALLVGFKTRIIALLLAGFTLVAGLIFHSNFGDQMQFILFTKNLAISGGLLYVFAAGAGNWSVDRR